MFEEFKEKNRNLMDKGFEPLIAQASRDQKGVSDNLEEEFTELYVWGNDFYGQLGVGSDKCVHRLPKVCSFNIVIKQVSCGEEHTAFVSQEGGHVYCMGSNRDGILGVGEKTLKSSNVPCLVESIENIVKVACGLSHTLAISHKGEAYAWGQGFYGALGVSKNGLDTHYKPQVIDQLSKQNIVDIAAGNRHSLFLTSLSKVYGCGDSKSGQLGIGQLPQVDRIMMPTEIQGLVGQRIKAICCGKFHSLFLTQSGEVWSTGGNSFGQLGIGSKKNQFEPVKIAGITDVQQLSAWHFSAATTSKNELYVWGTGIFGEHLTPKLMNFRNLPISSIFSEVNVGESFTTLIDKSGKVLVWGANTNGEMGLGDNQPRINPTYLSSIDDKQIITVGQGSTFAFALGQRRKNHENYQTHITEEGTLMTQQFENDFSYKQPTTSFPSGASNDNRSQMQHSIEKQKDYQVENLKSDIDQLVQQNTKLVNQVKDQREVFEINDNFWPRDKHNERIDKYLQQISKIEKEMADLQYRLREREKTIELLKDQNANLQADLSSINDNQREKEQFKAEAESLRRSESTLKAKCQALEAQLNQQSDYALIKTELDKVRREKEDFQYKLSRQQKETTLRALPNNQSHQLLKGGTQQEALSVLDSPNKIANIGKVVHEPSSPLGDEKSKMKLEDLSNKNKDYDPVWRLQVTDDTSKVLYDGRFVDKNNGKRDFQVENRMPQYPEYKTMRREVQELNNPVIQPTIDLEWRDRYRQHARAKLDAPKYSTDDRRERLKDRQIMQDQIYLKEAEVANKAPLNTRETDLKKDYLYDYKKQFQPINYKTDYELKYHPLERRELEPVTRPIISSPQSRRAGTLELELQERERERKRKVHFEQIEERPVDNKDFFKIELKPIEVIPSTDYAVDRREAERANIDRDKEDRKYVFHEPPRYHYNGYQGDRSPGNLPYERLGFRQTPERQVLNYYKRELQPRDFNSKY